MPNYSKNDLILVRYPFSDLSAAKVRPAVVVSQKHTSRDLFIVPLTSQISSLLDGEFVITDWRAAGLNTPSAVKRGIFTIIENFAIKRLGQLQAQDARALEESLKNWLAIS